MLLKCLFLLAAAAFAIACGTSPTPTAAPQYTLEVLVEPPQGGELLLDPQPGREGTYLADTTVSIEILLQAGWAVKRWVGPVYEIEGGGAKVDVTADQRVVVHLTRIQTAPVPTPVSPTPADAAEPNEPADTPEPPVEAHLVYLQAVTATYFQPSSTEPGLFTLILSVVVSDSVGELVSGSTIYGTLEDPVGGVMDLEFREDDPQAAPEFRLDVTLPGRYKFAVTDVVLSAEAPQDKEYDPRLNLESETQVVVQGYARVADQTARIRAEIPETWDFRSDITEGSPIVYVSPNIEHWLASLNEGVTADATGFLAMINPVFSNEGQVDQDYLEATLDFLNPPSNCKQTFERRPRETRQGFEEIQELFSCDNLSTFYHVLQSDPNSDEAYLLVAAMVRKPQDYRHFRRFMDTLSWNAGELLAPDGPPFLADPDNFQVELFADLGEYPRNWTFRMDLTSGENGFPAGLYVPGGPSFAADGQVRGLFRVDGPNDVKLVEGGFDNGIESIIFAKGDYGEGMLLAQPQSLKILRLLADGTLTTFAELGTEPFGPASLAYGADSFLYATDFAGARVLRVFPDGSHEEFAQVPLPPPESVSVSGVKPLIQDLNLAYGGGLITGTFSVVSGATDQHRLDSLFLVPTGVSEGALVDGSVAIPLASGFTGIEFLNFGPGGDFGDALYVSTHGTDLNGDGAVYTLTPEGEVAPFLTGLDAMHAVFDTEGILGGGMFVGDLYNPTGAPEELASRIFRVTRTVDLTKPALTVEEIYQRALDRFDEGRNLLAMVDLSSITSTHPDFAMAYYTLGQLYYQRRDFEKALPLHEEFLKRYEQVDELSILAQQRIDSPKA